MPANHRLPATLTRSLSFRYDLLAALDAKAAAMRVDRSSLVNGVLEHMLGLAPHPELVGRSVAFVPDRARAWEEDARRLEREALKDRATKRNHRAAVRAEKATPSGGGELVRRPGRR
jgi:hypothetical protein